MWRVRTPTAVRQRTKPEGFAGLNLATFGLYYEDASATQFLYRGIFR
jgi:hypothetical protein